MSVFDSKAIGGVIVCPGADWPEDLLKKLLVEARKAIKADLKVVDKQTLMGSVSEHVLSFKPLLKRLSLAIAGGKIDDFVKENWRILTPEALAANLVAASGLVKGIGVCAVNAETGQPVGGEEVINELKRINSLVQLRIWLNIICHDWIEEYSFEDALYSHVKENCAYEKNLESFSKLVDDMNGRSEKIKISPKSQYTSLALEANLFRAHGARAPHEQLWASAYFQFESAFLEADDSRALWPLRVSKKRAADTIGEMAAWNAAGGLLMQTVSNARVGSDDMAAVINRAMECLKEIADGIGYESLIERVIGSFYFKAQKDSPRITEQVVHYFLSSSEMPIPLVLYSLKHLLLSTGDMSLIERTFELAMARIGNDWGKQALSEAWLGECSKLMRCPGKFISRIGDAPRSWEAKLSLDARLPLWTERANALRLLARPEEALRITDSLLSEVGERMEFESQRFILLKNRGILLRETGFMQQSLAQLRDLLEGVRIDEKAELLDSIAATLTRLGRYSEAIDALREALPFAPKDAREIAVRLSAKIAALLAHEGLGGEAIAILRELPDEPDILVKMHLLDAYLALHFARAGMSEEDNERLIRLASSYSSDIDEQAGRGDIQLASQMCALIGNAFFIKDPVSSKPIWMKRLRLLVDNAMEVDPITIGRLAHIAYIEGQRDALDLYLKMLPRAMAIDLQGITDLATGFNATISVRPVFDDLLSAALAAGAPWGEVRLIAELNRDAIGRARLMRSGRVSQEFYRVTKGLFDDRAVAKIASAAGQVAVLEFAGAADCIVGFATVVDAEGRVKTSAIGECGLDLIRIRNRIRHLLSVWHVQRDGDPFEDREWVEFEGWLADAVGELVTDGSHVIVIGNQELIGLPWHIALASRWRCSYAPSWTTVLDGHEPGIKPRLTVGIFGTHRYNDPPVVCRTLDAAAESTKHWAESQGHEIVKKWLTKADRGSFTDLMNKCDIVEILCHGFSDPNEHEVALLIADGGVIPPMFAGGSRVTLDSHLLSWRDMQNLKRSAPLVLSAACSTGLPLQAGAGEQLGLFGALRQSGTKSFIGPRWDVDAESVLPLLGNFLKRYLGRGEPAINALHDTCLEAQNTLPRWLAWSLALEGDWR